MTSDGRSHPSDRPRPAVALVLLAAGSGTRTGLDTNKVLQPLAGRSVLAWSLSHQISDLARTVVVVRAEDREYVSALLARQFPTQAIEIVTGGRTRHESELHALRALEPAITADEIDVVLIHDAARPLASTQLFDQVIGAARAYGGAIPVVRRGDLADVDTGRALEHVVTVQTPQAFQARPLLAAYQAAQADGFEGTDTAAAIEKFTSLTIRAVAADPGNIKITFPEDLALAARLLPETTP